MIEKIKFKHLHDNIYSYYVDILDTDLNSIDKLYLEFKYNNMYCTFAYEYTIKFMLKTYNIVEYEDFKYIEFLRFNYINYKKFKYLTLHKIIAINKTNYLNKIRTAKLKSII